MARAPKRGANEGTVARRADGRWEARLRLAGERHSFYGRTQDEAWQKLAEAKARLERGLALQDDRITVAAFLATWLDDVAAERVAPKTLASYRQLVDGHIAPELGQIRLTKLTAPQVQSFLNSKRRGGLSPRSVAYLRSVLRNALNQAVAWGLVERNAAELTHAPRQQKRQAPVLSPDDAKAVLAACAGDRIGVLVQLVLSLGLRQGEALGLLWSDVDLEKGILRVRHQLQRLAGQYALREPKRNSQRTLPLPPPLLDALRSHRTRQKAERLAAGGVWQESPDFVFRRRDGQPLEGSGLTKHFQKLLADAGLPKLRFHDLRHACASLLVAQGVHPRVVMEVLGHSQIGVTMDTYAHVLPATTGEAVAGIAALLEDAG